MTNRRTLVALSLLFVLLVAGGAPLLAQDATPEATPEATAEPLPPGVILTINDDPVTVDQFQDWVRVQQFLAAYTLRTGVLVGVAAGLPVDMALNTAVSNYGLPANMLTQPEDLAPTMLSQLIATAQLEQLTAENDISINDEDIDALVLDYVTRTAEAAGIEPDVDAFYGAAESEAGISADILRSIFAAQVQRERITEQVVGEFPDEQELVTARHILVETEAEGDEVVARLGDGEDFADLAGELSLDPGSGAQGGDLGANPPDIFVPPFADAIRDAEMNVILGPVETQFGFHIIEVTARETVPLDDQGRAMLERARLQEFNAWLEAQPLDINFDPTIDAISIYPDLPDGLVVLDTLLLAEGIDLGLNADATPEATEAAE